MNVPVPTMPGAAASGMGAEAGAGSNASGSAVAGECGTGEAADATSEKMRKFAEQHPDVVNVMTRINTTQSGWTLRADTLVDGSGIAGGAAYRRSLAQDRASFDVMGMLSINAYYLLTAGVTYTLPAQRRVVLHGALRHESYPEEDFYGLGRESRNDQHTAYWRQVFDSIGGATFAIAPSFHVTGTAGVLNVRMLSGREGGVPSTEDRFSPADVPGLTPGTWTSYLHLGAGLDIDRTDGNPVFPKGGRYRGSFSRYKGIGDPVGQFSRVDLDVRQYLPVPRTDTQVVAVRVLTSSVSGDAADQVPFYFLPRLGGDTTLRSYGTSRFMDRSALAVSAEYRVLMMKRLQVLGLVDLGDVAPHFSALRPSKFHSSTGFGARYQFAPAFLAGADVAHGSEGWAAIVRLGQAF
jgi:hypothetical protein